MTLEMTFNGAQATHLFASSDKFGPVSETLVKRTKAVTIENPRLASGKSKAPSFPSNRFNEAEI